MIAATRYVSLGSIITALVFPIAVLLTRLMNHQESKLEIKNDITDKFDETF